MKQHQKLCTKKKTIIGMEKESFQIKKRELLPEKLIAPIESSEFVSHQARISLEFYSKKDSRPIKLEETPHILLRKIDK